MLRRRKLESPGRTATLLVVRRVIFILLLAILPVQFTWAAATAYCRHESGEATKHFGHHEHQHHATKDGESKGGKAASSSLADSDCSVCQLGAAQPVPSSAANIPVTGTAPPRFALSARYESHIPSGPERPDRSAPTPAVRFGGAVVIDACSSAQA